MIAIIIFVLHTVFGGNAEVNIAANWIWSPLVNKPLEGLNFHAGEGRMIVGMKSHRPEKEAEIRVYWDEGNCGPDGDDARWDWCGHKTLNCQSPVQTDLCASGSAEYFKTVGGNGNMGSYYHNGCKMGYLVHYRCTDQKSLDRVWKFKTSSVSGMKCTALSWRGHVNNAGGPLNFQCDGNQALAAVEGTWIDGNKDRVWRYKCCDISSDSRYRIENVVSTNYLNEVDEAFELSCNRNEVLVGVTGYFDQNSKDRRWLAKCGLVTLNEDTSDAVYPQILTKYRSFLGKKEEASCWKMGPVYDPLDGAGVGPIVGLTNPQSECQMECRMNGNCAKWSLVWEVQGWVCHLTSSNAVEVQANGQTSKIGPRNGCYDRRTAVYKLAKAHDCKYYGWDFITNWDECMRAAKFFGITDNQHSNVGNRQIWCGTWNGLASANYNSQSSGSINGAPLLTTATANSHQICRTSGWANEYATSFKFEMRGAPVMLDVGKSRYRTKKIDDAGTGELSCPKAVSGVGPDSFEVDVAEGKDMQISRPDGQSWDMFVRHQCWEAGNDVLITGLESRYNPYVNDRQFMFSTTQVPGVTCKALEWTGNQNSIGGELDFKCPEGHAMAGFGSTFSNGDRHFEFRCCDVRSTFWTLEESPRAMGWSNYGDGVHQHCQHNEVVIGLRSQYNGNGDRRFGVRCGVLRNWAKTFDDCIEINILEMTVKEVIFEEVMEAKADLQTMKATFDYCGNPHTPSEIQLKTSGEESIQKTETLELEHSLDRHFSFSNTMSVRMKAYAEITRKVKKILREKSFTAGMEFGVGNAMTGELGFDIGSAETRTSEVSVEKVQANSVETTFQPLPYEKYVAEGSYGTQYAKVPVSMRAQCVRKEGGFSEATIDAFYKTQGMTFITVKYEDRTNTCPQSYYKKCECVENMSSQFVGSGCTVHPKFNGAEGCYVYKGRENSDRPTCTNAMPLGTAEPRAGVEVDANNWDYGVDGVNFGWSYSACGGAQYYPGDANYKGVQYGDLIWKQPNRACQWGSGGTLSEIPYPTKNAAITECYNKNLRNPNTCLGVYDAGCDDTGSFFLCSPTKELTRSGQGSCVWRMTDAAPDSKNNPFDAEIREKKGRGGGHETAKTKSAGGLSDAKKAALEEKLQKKKQQLKEARQNKELAKKERKELKSKLKNAIKRIKKKLQEGEADELIAPGGLTAFQPLFVEFGMDLRPCWCNKYGCEDFEAQVANL